MNFFKSILSDDTNPPKSENPQKSDPNSPSNPSYKHYDENDAIDQDQSCRSHGQPNSNPNSTDGGGWGGWRFGGLIQSYATQSGSVLQTYRRDLREFGSGLKKETSLFREVASRAVKDLPYSIEAAHEVIDGVLKSTAKIISHRKEALLSASDFQNDTPDTSSSCSSRRYSRFDALLRTIQSDVKTYCEEPENLEDYNNWKLGFVLEEKSQEVENLIGDSGALEGIYKRVVPNEINHGTFWSRYFYRVHKLNQQESVRANLVKRAVSINDEEELTWDVDDEDDKEQELKESSKGEELEHNKVLSEDWPQMMKGDSYEVSQSGSSRVDGGKEEHNSNVGKADHGESCRYCAISIVSSQQSVPDEEELGWDEIEDVGSSDEKRVTGGGSLNRAELRKRLSAAEEDEDLTWDIEDDDEPVKA
ncbi:unnamed protein product [Ilex paraguariensis]|uniref:BSD domain-containing protein n=1 Tax=Ilex paraguariensis TaxID=185542 RepID=A0ABC8UQS8_9AQUA